jgi:iron(III) transport system permease protein
MQTHHDFKWVTIAPSVALTAYLALVPLAFLLWQSFLTPHTATKVAELTLGNYRSAYANAETARLLFVSIQYAAGSAVVAFAIGATLAWMNERTNTPFKTLFFALALIPLIIPGILFTVSWILLASPKIGIINLALQQLFNTGYVFVDIYSLPGMIWVDGLHYSPMAFLLMTAAFRSMDPALEESAMMSGAGILETAWRVTLKLAYPAVVATLLILFVRSIESFEVPALLGLPVGIHVFTSSIYEAIHQYPSQVGLACAYGMTLLLITTAGVYLQSRVSQRGSRYSTITGKGFRPRPIDLGNARYFTAALFIAYLLLIVVLPFLVLVWSSLQKFYAPPSIAALRNLTLDPYRFIFSHAPIADAVWNTLVLAIGTATVIMVITSVICWITVKTKVPGRWLLDTLASVPLMLPGIVLGLAILIFYLNFRIGVYNTLWILFIAYLTRFLPYGMRYNTTSMLQIHRELEESAQMSGASWLTTFRRILLPLLKPGLVAGWIYIVIVSTRELSTSILLYGPDSELVSIVIWELWENGQYVELSALGVLFIVALLVLVVLAQLLARRFGLKEVSGPLAPARAEG